MPMTNAEKQAAWRKRRDARLGGMERELEALRKEVGRLGGRVDLQDRCERMADLTVQARDAILSEKGCKAADGIESGRYLLDLKTMIDADSSLADGETFWQWFDRFFVKEKICSRKDAEKRIVLAVLR